MDSVVGFITFLAFLFIFGMGLMRIAQGPSVSNATLVKSGHAEYVLENDKAVFKLKECR